MDSNIQDLKSAGLSYSYFFFFQENNAFFVTTNIIATPHQTQTVCPEVSVHISSVVKINQFARTNSIYIV